MKFISRLFGWLFSNLFLILVVVALCYAYVYWNDPFGKDTPVGKVMAQFPEEVSEAKAFIADVTGIKLDKDTDDSHETASSSAGESAPSDSADSAASSTVASAETAGQVSGGNSQVDATQSADNEASGDVEGAGDSPVVASVPQTSIRPAPATAATSGSSEQKPATAGFTPAAEFSDEGAAPSVSADDETARAQKALVGDVFVPPEVEVALNQLHNDGSVEDVAVMQKADKPAEQLFIDAREAFYRRDYDASIAAYKQLIANNKDNYDAYGELGNVYFTKGDMELAAEAYYQAATIMVTKGQKQRAASLIGFLASVDAEKAKKLGEMLVPDNQQDAL